MVVPRLFTPASCREPVADGGIEIRVRFAAAEQRQQAFAQTLSEAAG